MKWYRISLPQEQVAEGVMQRYKDDFYKAFKAANAPRMMALFQREGQDGGLELFFTPDCGEHAASLLAEWNVAHCEPPQMAGLELLVGFNEITYYLF